MNLTQAIASHFQIENVEWKEWNGINCPFHSDSNASAGLNFETKRFNCYVCGPKTFFRVATELNIDFDGWEVELENTQPDRDWLNNLIEDTTKPKKKTLNQQAKEYADFLYSRQIKPETIEEIGGYYVSDINNIDYGHLVIPYGQGKHFKRRILGATRDTKFRQSESTERGDSKSLFGSIDSKWETVILCEGITDFATLWQMGCKNICTSFGANTSDSQMYLLRGKTVFIIFDRDYAGAKGAKRASKQLEEWGANAIILEIPEEFGDGFEKIDINSAYCHSGDRFVTWFNQSIKSYNVFDSDYVRDIFLSNNRTVNYVSTGIRGLDDCLSGGFATGVHAIAGMPEAGKTTFKTYMTDIFYQQGYRVLSLDYELTKEQNYARLASRKSKHSWVDIEKDHSILERETVDYLSNLSKKIRIETGWTIEQVKLASKSFDIIIVDYIQRMPYDGDDPRMGIQKNARQLSNLTRDGKIIIIISSIPRSMYEKTGKSVFKETGDIEYICQSGYIITKVLNNVMEIQMIKNTRGESRTHYVETGYANQLVREISRPNFVGVINE